MIRDPGVAHRYAAALFGAARSRSEDEAVLADLQSIERLYELDPALKTFLEAPDVLAEQKEALIRGVLGGRVSELVVRFLLLMLRKKRIQHLSIVFGHYRKLVEELHGIERARVVTAVPLAPDLAEPLRQRLETLSGKRVLLELRVDPAVLGGVVVTLGDKIIDGSLRHRLDEMRDRLLRARVRE